jgi:O-acetyl-ADP-ribose deacetylase (regulator of RNase III)
MQPRIYKLTPTTKLFIRRGDITTFTGDGICAIVNAANERMLGGGGVDGAIHRAAGPELLEACKAVPMPASAIRCPTGEARITPGNFGLLKVNHIIHTVGPIYENEERSAPLLKDSYRSSMVLANENKVHSIAFPAISCGVYGYPLHTGAKIALETVQEEAAGGESSVKEVHFYLFGEKEVMAWVDEAEGIALEKEEEEGKEEERR